MAFQSNYDIVPQNYADKELLLSRIKDLEFVDDASEFKCKRCRKVLLQHYISNCGHAFCSNCKKLLGDGSGQWKCPECQEYVVEIDFQDFEFEQKLFDLRVFCVNKKYGCSFSCLLKNLAEHLKSCDNTREHALPVLCEEPNTLEKILKQMEEFNQRFGTLNANIGMIEENLVDLVNQQADVEIKLEAIDNRLDSVNSALQAKDDEFNKSLYGMKCEFVKLIAAEIESLSDSNTNVNAQLKIIENKIDMKEEDMWKKPNSQSFQQQIDRLKDEIKSLQLSLSNDDFEFRIDMVAENASVAFKLEDLDGKMDLIMPQISRLENFIKMIELQTPLKTFKEIYAKKPADFLWNIDDVRSKLKQNEFEIESETLNSTDCPFEIRAKLKSENGILLPSLRITNDVMPSPLPTIYLIFRANQVEERDWDIIRSSSCEFPAGKNRDYVFQGIDKSMFSGLFNHYVRNNALLMKIYVEPLSVAHHAFSFDGILNWSIENYRKKKECESGRYVLWNESPYFYTSANGYRVQARMMLSYKDMGVAAEIRFLSDERLDQLSFPHKTTVTILNQKHPNGHVTSSKTKSSLETTSYIIYLGTHREIERIIENDTLHCQVKIEPM